MLLRIRGLQGDLTPPLRVTGAKLDKPSGEMATSNGNSTEVIRFSVFEVNLKAGELRRNGSRLKVQEQPFQILASLLERPGEIVTRDELRSRLWPQDTFVDFDHGLNAAVRRLRDTLGDSAETPRFVETVARRGYRFIAPVNGFASAIAPATTRSMTPSHRRHWLLTGVALAVLLTGLVVGWNAGHRSASPQPSIRERRLTANPTDTPVLSSALSPDGRYLAFADKTGFYLRQVDNGETHPIALPKNFDARPAAWFPDNTHLLVTWVSGPQESPSLWKISIMGGEPQKLTDSGHDPSVSPDATQIAFLRGSFGVPEVWLMQSDGENLRKLIGQEKAPFGPVAWSPDGRHIAYYQSAYHFGVVPFDNQIKTLDLSTQKTDLVLADSRLGPGLAWTQTGRLLYSLAEAPPSQNDSNVWSAPIDARTGKITGPSQRITKEPGYIGGLNATADGKKLAMAKFGWQPDVYITNLEAHGARLSAPQRLTLDDRLDFPYSWTPDNKSVFFVSDRDGQFHIYKQAIDSAIATLMMGGQKPLTIPRLSPDGNMLIFLVTPEAGDSTSPVELMRVPLGGGPPVSILKTPRIANQQCARFPSELCIFTTINDQAERFFQFDPIKGTQQELPWIKIADRYPYNFNWTLSPDGKFLAISKKDNVQKDPSLRVVSVADHTQKIIKVQTWAGISSIDWAADSKSIWAIGYTTRDTWAVLNVDMQGRVRPMLEEKNMRIGWGIPSPDGKHLALWEANGSANIWLVDNF